MTEQPELVELQNAGMSAGGDGMGAAMLDTYRLPDGKIVTDPGGADGNVLMQLPANEPDRQDIVFDLPSVVDSVPDAQPAC